MKIRVVASVRTKNDVNWIEDLWKELEIPFAPFVGLEISFDDPIDEVLSITEVLWIPAKGIVIAYLEDIDCRSTENFDRNWFFHDGWQEGAGLWSPE